MRGKLFATLIPAGGLSELAMSKIDFAAQLKKIWGDKVFTHEEVREMMSAELGQRRARMTYPDTSFMSALYVAQSTSKSAHRIDRHFTFALRVSSIRAVSSILAFQGRHAGLSHER